MVPSVDNRIDNDLSLSKIVIFAEYNDPRLVEQLDLKESEANVLRSKAEKAKSKFLADVNKLVAEHHKKFRGLMDSETLAKVESEFGDPLAIVESNFVIR